MLLFVLDTVIGTGWDQRGEAATIYDACSIHNGLDRHQAQRRAHLIPRTRQGTPAEADSFPPDRGVTPGTIVPNPYAGASSVQRNSLPSIHMRCMITASLRASATRARFKPRFLAIRMAQAFSADHRVVRVSTTLAAS